MADAAAKAALKKKRTFRKYSYRGVDLENLLDVSQEQLTEMVTARARRRFNRGRKLKHESLLKRLRKAKKATPEGEKPAPVKTHLRNMIIVPEMIGSVVAVYNGKVFNIVEIRVSPPPSGASFLFLFIKSFLLRKTWKRMIEREEKEGEEREREKREKREKRVQREERREKRSG